MYKLDTGQARTDLYGIGKGEAQIFDLSDIAEQAKLAKKEKLAKEAEKQKAGEARNVYAQNLLKTTYKGDVLPSEQNYFAGEAAKIKENLLKKMSVSGYVNQADVLDIEQSIADLSQKAGISKNYREFLETQIKEIGKTGENKYAKEDIESLTNAYGRTNPEDIGVNYKLAPISPLVNVNERVNSVLGPIADDMKKQSGRVTKLTIDEAKSIADKDISDPSMAAGIDKLYRNMSEEGKRGAKNYKDWYIETVAPMLVRNDRTPSSQWEVYGAGGGGAKKAGATDVLVTRNSDGSAKVTVPGKKNEAVEITGAPGQTKKLTIISPDADYDKNGQLIGGTAIDLMVRAENERKAKIYDSQLEVLTKNLQEAQTAADIQFESAKNDEGKKKAVEQGATAAKAIQRQIDLYKQRRQSDMKNENVRLTKKQVEDAYTRLTGNYPTDILKGVQSAEVNRIEDRDQGGVGVSGAVSTKKYNGTDYTFDELKQMGKKAKKTDKEIEDFWNTLP
jgi:hypothetical protein